MTLTEFLLARIAEDEAVARSVDEHLIRSLRSIVRHAPLPGGEVLHIVRWDPARVLAECEAKRRIIQAFVPNFETETDRQYQDRIYAHAGGGKYHPPLLALALPYADHPEYRPEWAPDAVAAGEDSRS